MELEVDLGGTPVNDTANNHVLLQKCSALGVVGSYYDQIAAKVGNSAGNIRMGVYDDTGSTVPNVKLAETGIIAMPASSTYTYQSITEFALTTAQAWLGMNWDNASATIERANGLAVTIHYKQPVTGNDLTTPVSGFSTTQSPFRMKIKHS